MSPFWFKRGHLCFLFARTGACLRSCQPFSTGSITDKKYAVISSGDSCILRESHQSTVSTKDEAIWFTR